MEKYLFETHYGRSTVTDTEAGVIVEWTNGDFNGTNRARVDALHFRAAGMDAGELAAFMAKVCREIGDYVTANYPELL